MRNTFICGDSSKPFSLIWLKSLIVRCLWLTFSWNWRCFWDSNSWMLYSLHNRIDRTFAFIAAGIYTFWLANSKKILFRLLQKYHFILGWLALHLCCDIYQLKIPTQESKWIKSEKGLACWKRLTPWKRLGLLKAPDSVAFKALIIT